LSAVIAAAEREARAVRLLIVPGVDVFDSVIDTAIRLHSAEIHVGESETLSADDQARPPGQARRRAAKPSTPRLRPAVHHPPPPAPARAGPRGAQTPPRGQEVSEHTHRFRLPPARPRAPGVARRDGGRPAPCQRKEVATEPNPAAPLQIISNRGRPADRIAAL